MKYLKIKVKRGDAKKGEHQMLYPDCYDPMEIQQSLIGGIIYPNEIGKGASEEDCVLCLSDDALADKYVTESNGDIKELSETQVDTFMNTRWERRNDPEERVTDPDRILGIQVKNKLNIALSKEDHDALDPDLRVPGINRVNKDHNIFRHRFKVDNKKGQERTRRE